jgi:hypothetical protein
MTYFEKWMIFFAACGALSSVFWAGYGWGVIRTIEKKVDWLTEWAWHGRMPQTPPPLSRKQEKKSKELHQPAGW